MPTASTKTEQIDERILRILGLEQQEVEMDYLTYYNSLREAISKGAFDKGKLPEEELALLANERKRIRSKKGRFKLKTKKVKINASSAKSPIKEKRKMLPTATKITESPIKEKRKMLPGANDKEKAKEKGESLAKIVNTQGKLLSKIAKTLNSSAKKEEKIQSKKNKLIKRKKDEKKKDKREENLEKKKGGLSGLTKAADKILAPVKGLFQRIFDYLKLTALNFVVGSVYKWFTDPANKEKIEKIKNFFTSIGDWFQDPENQKKLSTIGKFLKDNWKVILGIGGVILLWNLGIGAIVGAIGSAIKVIGATLLLLAKNPLIAAAIGIGAGLTYLSTLPSAPDADVDESVEEIGKEETLQNLKNQQENRNIFQKMGDFITGADSEREEQIYRLETGEEKRYNKGGMVPVMLTKGEYVVPPDQAKRIGAPTLYSINNIKNYNKGGNITNNNYNQGGLIPGRGPNIDTVRTELREGSFVIQRPAVDAVGANNLQSFVNNYNTGGSVRNSNTTYNTGGPVSVRNNSTYNTGGSVRNNSTYNTGGSVSVRNGTTSKSNFYNTGGSIRNFLNFNKGGEISGSAGIGRRIVEGAKRIVGYKKGVGDMCANTTRAALAAAGHPAAKKRTQVGDLDTPKGTAYNGPNFAASFGGSDMGKIITQKSQIKPGDIILWRALRDINPSKGITRGAITHVGIAADNGLKNQYDHSSSRGFHYRPHWDTSSGTKWFAGVRLGSSGGMLPPELPAGGVSGGGGGGSGGSGDGRDSTSSPFASSGMGMLLKELGFTNDEGKSIGKPTENSKMKVVASTSPTDIGEDRTGGETTAAVSSLSPSKETKDMRQGPKNRATETTVRQGANSITLYDWNYEKIYGIQGA